MGRRRKDQAVGGPGPLFRARDAAAYGIFPGWLSQADEYGLVTRVARGLYSKESSPLPRAALALFRTPHAIGALESALHLQRFVVEEPPVVWLGLAENARKPRFSAAPVECVRWRYEPFPEDVTFVSITRTFRVRVFTLAKTAVDFLRLRNRLGVHHALPFVEAILELAISSDQLLACAVRNRALTLARRFLDQGPAAFLPSADGNPPRITAVSS